MSIFPRRFSLANRTAPLTAIAPAICCVMLFGFTLSIPAIVAPPRSDVLSDGNALNVLVITIDTLRADHVGCYGATSIKTPAIDSLAALGIRFENALSQVPLTLPSHTSILSGTYPAWNGVRDFTQSVLRPEVGLIAEAFKRHGYSTAAFVSSVALDSSWGLSRGFETYDDQFNSGKDASQSADTLERRAGDTVDRLLAWINARESSGKKVRNSFVWLHVYDPHRPYDPPEPFRSRYASHLYDGEIAYADSQLSRVFEALRRNGTFDKTLIVLLSDHGESLGEHGEEDHGFFVYRSTLRVPLIIKLPRSRANSYEPKVIHEPVAILDVAPTLLDLVNVQDSIQRQFQGSSLASLALGKSSTSHEPVYSESFEPEDSYGWSPLRSVSTARYQYIDAPRAELYDIVRDPAEVHNLKDSATGSALRDQLLNIENRYTNHSPAVRSPALSTEMQEKLKSLGYVSYAAPRVPINEKNLPDPKDRVQFHQKLLNAQRLALRGRFEQSDELLESLQGQDPNLYLIPCDLAQNAARERRLPDAEREFLACLKLNSKFDTGMMGLAQVTSYEGKPDQARAWLELAIHYNPLNYMAYYQLGQLRSASGDTTGAQHDFQKAVELKPSYAPAQLNLGATFVAQQRYRQALPPLAAAASLGLQDPALFYALGITYLHTERTANAIECLQRALSMNSDLTPARLGLSLAYLKSGDRPSATREFHVVCTHDANLCSQYRKVFEQ